MVKKGKNKGKRKPVGRPRKYEKGLDKKDIYTSITVTKDVARRIKKYKTKKDANISDTINGFILVCEKIGRDFLGMENAIPQEILDAIDRIERESVREDNR